MPATPWESAATAELYVRSDLPTATAECQTNAIRRLERLVADGALADYRVLSWAKRVAAEEDARGECLTGEFERERYDAFSEWAGSAGVDLRPFFDTRECYCSVTGQRRTELVMPALCLALFGEDGELVGVAPHADDDGSLSVPGCLDALADRASGDRTRQLTSAD